MEIFRYARTFSWTVVVLIPPPPAQKKHCVHNGPNALNTHVCLVNWIFNREFTTADGHSKGAADTNCRNLSRNSSTRLLFVVSPRLLCTRAVFAFFAASSSFNLLVAFKGLELARRQGCSLFAYLRRDALLSRNSATFDVLHKMHRFDDSHH